MCFIVPVSPQRHLSSSSLPHLTRLTGEGSTSYVDLMRKLILDVVHFQSSRQVTFLSSTFSSHAMICPCWPHCASLVVLLCCSCLLTCSVTASRLSLGILEQKDANGRSPSPDLSLEAWAAPTMSPCSSTPKIESVSFYACHFVVVLTSVGCP